MSEEEGNKDKKMKMEMFSTERIVLQREANKHPKLVKLLEKYAGGDWPSQIGEIAAYCNVVLDGVYTPSELDDLSEHLYWKLKKKRVIVVI